MFNVTIYDKSKKLFKTYRHITTVKYFDILKDWVAFTGDDILTHTFPSSSSYQLLGDNGNYSIDKSVIGSIEIERDL